jgi:hypothetical protein
MIRHLLTGVAAFALMTGASFAQNGYSSTTTTTFTRNADVAPVPVAPVQSAPDTGGNMVKGGVSGAALGAAIGCVATIPIGCAPGAAFGAAVGGGGGAAIGLVASATPPRYDYAPR